MADAGGVDQLKEIELLVRARYPLLYVVSWEEDRVLAALADLGQRRRKRVYTWSCSTGIVSHGASAGAAQGKPSATTKDVVGALQAVREHVEPALFVFKDLHPFLTKNDFYVVRVLRDLALALKASYKTLVILSPTLQLPPDLEKDVTVVDYRLPGAPELGKLLDRVAKEVAGNPKLQVDLDADVREDLLKAAQGLTLAEAENVFAKSLVRHGRLGREQIADILLEKRQIIRKSGILDYFDPDVSLEEVGGLEQLKDWLAKRRLAFTDRAHDFGLPPPKGVLLLGVQGCGKSLCAKAISALWNLPLLRLDVGRIFSSMMGGSEENIRRAISVAEGVAPCILWVDEIDKAFGGLTRAGSGDGGTAQRVLGTFLTWLAEKDSAVFVAATANDITVLPPEMLRKGRFDEIFFVDLPDAAERENILAIHLKARGRNPKYFRLAELAAASDGFSGAELEQAVISALFDAFYDEGREVTGRDILKAVGETVPLSRTAAEGIENLREWCATRARPASAATAAPTGPSSRLEAASFDATVWENP